MGSFSFFQWAIFAGIAFLLIRPFWPKDKSAMICPACGSCGPAEVRVRGSIWIEIILWLMLIVPGIIYSIWRLTTKQSVCSSCGQPGLIPTNTPRGAELSARFHHNPVATGDKVTCPSCRRETDRASDRCGFCYAPVKG